MKIIRYAVMLAAAVTLSSCGGGSSTPTTPTPPTNGGNNGTPVTIVNGARALTTTAYNPNPVTVSAGTTVTWTNQDTTTHTATSDSGLFSSGNVGPNGQFSFTFANKGTFTYHCALHPNMVGSVVVQ
jgi:plastocyanin